MAENICRVCGRTESEHHAFEPEFEGGTPGNCQCDLETWRGGTITKICDSYDGDGHQHCRNCEHDEACHGD